MENLTSGQFVRLLREAAGLTRDELAWKCELSVSTLARLELNNRLPSTSGLIRLALVLGVTLDEIVNPNSESPALADSSKGVSA